MIRAGTVSLAIMAQAWNDCRSISLKGGRGILRWDEGPPRAGRARFEGAWRKKQGYPLEAAEASIGRNQLYFAPGWL
jgi:hypothetical protein